jgi:hypothetical protein
LSVEAAHESGNVETVGLVTARPPGTEGAAVSGAPVEVTTNCGAFAPDSRDASEISIQYVPTNAKLNVPLPVTAGVTSSCTHPVNAPLGKLPNFAPNAGAFAYVNVDSPQLVFATEYASKPQFIPEFAYTRNTADCTDPDNPLTLNLKNAVSPGYDGFTFNDVALP